MVQVYELLDNCLWQVVRAIQVNGFDLRTFSTLHPPIMIFTTMIKWMKLHQLRLRTYKETYWLRTSSFIPSSWPAESQVSAGIRVSTSVMVAVLRSVAVMSSSCREAAFSHSAVVTWSPTSPVCCSSRHLRCLQRCSKIFKLLPWTLRIEEIRKYVSQYIYLFALTFGQ